MALRLLLPVSGSGRGQSFRLWFTRHGREEMANDGIIEADVRRMLRAGSVSLVETKRDELWHVEGRAADGRGVRLVGVVVWEDTVTIKLVTAMTL